SCRTNECDPCSDRRKNLQRSKDRQRNMSTSNRCPRTWSLAALCMALCAVGLAGCGGGGGGGGGGNPPPPQPPNVPPAPTVQLDPPAGPTVNRTTTLTARVEAADTLEITGVEFLVDGTVIGEATEEPYSIEWDTSTVEDG